MSEANLTVSNKNLQLVKFYSLQNNANPDRGNQETAGSHSEEVDNGDDRNGRNPATTFDQLRQETGNPYIIDLSGRPPYHERLGEELWRIDSEDSDEELPKEKQQVSTKEYLSKYSGDGKSGGNHTVTLTGSNNFWQKSDTNATWM